MRHGTISKNIIQGFRCEWQTDLQQCSAHGLAAGAKSTFGLGYIRSYFEWQSIFLLFSVMIIVSMATIYFIKTKKHAAQIEKLELEYQEKLKESSPYSQEPEVLSSYHRD